MSEYLLVGAGLVLLFVGGEALLRGALGLAARSGLPPVVIGLTVVGFGTSMPELVVSLDAALGGRPDIALGNVVGSNIANILLILGVSALVWPIRTAGLSLRRDLVVMLAAALVLVPVLATGSVGRGAGAVLLAALVGYLVTAFRAARDETAPTIASAPLWRSLAFVAVGLGMLVFGARFLVDGAVSVARDFGVSEAFIGLTIVAIGTSLPELATSLVAAVRRQSAIAVGNVVGSNIFNVLGILGATALVAPIPAAPRFLQVDLPVMIAASFLMALLVLRSTIGRPAALGLVSAYALYIVFSAG